MNKGKLCSFAIAGIIGFLSISPVTTLAAEMNTEPITQSDNKKNQQDNKAVFEEKMKKAAEKWETLTAKQKNEVYSLLENEMKVENNIMDKLAELGVLDKEDVELIKTHMLKRYNQLKDSGEFPFLKQKSRNRDK